MTKSRFISTPNRPPRAKAYYAGLEWRLDADFFLGGTRAIQFTPPGPTCFIHFTTGA